MTQPGSARRRRRCGRTRRRPAPRRAGRDRHRRRAATRSARGADPAQPASAARSVLRRCAKAASITAKTSARVTPGGSGGGSRRVSATRPESTFGTGQKTALGTAPGAPDVGVPGGLDRRHPVRAGAGRRGQPLGHLGLHHDQPGAAASAASPAGAARTGTATLYGRLATRAVGCGSGTPASRRASAVSTVSRSARSGRRSATVRGSAAGQHRVELDGGHVRGGVEQAEGERAEPGTDLEGDVVRVQRRRSGRCGGPCSGRARSSARAPWSAGCRARRPARGPPPARAARGHRRTVAGTGRPPARRWRPRRRDPPLGARWAAPGGQRLRPQVGQGDRPRAW